MNSTVKRSKTTTRYHLPGDFAIWLFIFAELLVFGVFFLSFAIYRASHVELFNTYQNTLDRESGAINTLLLITVIIKGHWIIADFMELRHAGLLWRVLAHGWIILVSAGILLAYLMGS